MGYQQKSQVAVSRLTGALFFSGPWANMCTIYSALSPPAIDTDCAPIITTNTPRVGLTSPAQSTHNHIYVFCKPIGLSKPTDFTIDNNGWSIEVVCLSKQKNWVFPNSRRGDLTCSIFTCSSSCVEVIVGYRGDSIRIMDIEVLPVV